MRFGIRTRDEEIGMDIDCLEILSNRSVTW
jgi:hypothetical protein